MCVSAIVFDLFNSTYLLQHMSECQSSVEKLHSGFSAEYLKFCNVVYN